MEAKDDKTVITDYELLNLLHAAKNKDPQAMLKLINIYKADILRISQYIRMPKEDAVSAIIVEFLDLLVTSEISIIDYNKRKSANNEQR